MGSKPVAITMYSRPHQSIASVSSLAKWELIKSTYFVGLHEKIHDTLNAVHGPCENLLNENCYDDDVHDEGEDTILNNLERRSCNGMSPCSAALRVRKLFNMSASCYN